MANKVLDKAREYLKLAWEYLFKEEWKKVLWGVLLGDGAGGGNAVLRLLPRELLWWGIGWSALLSFVALYLIVKNSAKADRLRMELLSIGALLVSLVLFYAFNWLVKASWVPVEVADFLFFWIVPPFFGLVVASMTACITALLFAIDDVVSPVKTND